MDFADVIEFNELAYKQRKIMTDRVKMESLIDRSLSKIKLSILWQNNITSVLIKKVGKC